MVVKRLTAGAYEVRKIIEFRKPRGRGLAHVEARWETEAAPPWGPELWRIMEATAEADWPQEVRRWPRSVGLGKPRGTTGCCRPEGSPTKRCAAERRRTPCRRRPEWPSSS